jgi:Na+-transporting NADH:ubiquinone oxidoreductase subunit A
VDLERTAWHIGYQDVAAIGTCSPRASWTCSVWSRWPAPACTSPGCCARGWARPSTALTRGELRPAWQRVISGSVLDGRTAMGDVHGYLGRFHQQISVVAEAQQREMFGWIMPGGGQVLGLGRGVARRLQQRQGPGAEHHHQRRRPRDGAHRVLRAVMPLDLMPTFLLRALLMGHDERAEKLGCLELDEDDLALCTFVCPGKAEYGPLLRQALARIEKEAA